MTEFVERHEKVDCVMVDPPRKGCSTEFLERLTTLLLNVLSIFHVM